MKLSDRILELYHEATVIESTPDAVWGELDPLKFAELIIKECAKEVKDFYNCESIICYNGEEHLLGTFLNYFQEEE